MVQVLYITITKQNENSLVSLDFFCHVYLGRRSKHPYNIIFFFCLIHCFKLSCFISIWLPQLAQKSCCESRFSYLFAMINLHITKPQSKWVGNLNILCKYVSIYCLGIFSLTLFSCCVVVLNFILIWLMDVTMLMNRARVGG